MFRSWLLWVECDVRGGSRKMKRIGIIGACSRSCVSSVRLTAGVQERGFRGIILRGLRKEVVSGARKSEGEVNRLYG